VPSSAIVFEARRSIFEALFQALKQFVEALELMKEASLTLLSSHANSSFSNTS